ncbi:MAG: hypothetical protein KJ063_23370 [Anaerolineae bacterium]|nr:hypothetical protein [Anaerolineae bacterium]
MQLLIIDTAQIQGYVFGSNRLRENIGASYLVAQATGEWALTHLPTPNNVRNAQESNLDDDKWIERDGLAAEVIYAGGGNVVALFADAPKAEDYTRTYSRWLLKTAPNLQVVFWHGPFTWDDNKADLHQAVQAGFRQLAQKKASRTYSAPLLGLGVTQMCRSTAFPAVDVSEIEADTYPISREVQQKEKKFGKAKDRLDSYMRQGDRDWLATYLNGYQFPRDFDDLGRSEGEQSHIAVVHADGDGMGQRFRQVGADLPNREYIQAVRDYSRKVQEMAQAALQDTVKALVDQLGQHGGDKIEHRSAFGDLLAEVVLRQVDEETGEYYLPFRPIVFGGDDITFVCDGRLGLSLALEFIRQFEAHSVKLPDGQATASAGVAIVKSRYPFAQAYSLSAELAKEAKTYRRGNDLKSGMIDWHFARSGVLGKLEKVREREYQTQAGKLTLRPVTVGPNASKEAHRAWPVIAEGVTIFQDLHRKPEQKQPNWSRRRSKVKALREALRAGPAAVRQFRAKFLNNKHLPEVAASMDSWTESGWQGEWGGYFDALEMMDWFIPLHQPEGGTK